MKKIIVGLGILLIATVAIVTLTSNRQPVDDELIGTWVSYEDSTHKLIFTSNECRVYIDGELVAENVYSIVNHSCGEYSQQDSSYMKWVDMHDNFTSCLEISEYKENEFIALMVIDLAEVTIFHKQ